MRDLAEYSTRIDSISNIPLIVFEYATCTPRRGRP